MTEDPVKVAIMTECMELAEFLLSKNGSYGNSVLEGLGVFSGLGTIAAIDVRIDDKLKRIRNARINGKTDAEDSEKDLIGYLILKRVCRRVQG